MSSNYCVLCNISFALSDRYRRTRRPDVHVHEYCILKYDKDTIMDASRKFLLAAAGELAAKSFVLGADRLANPEKFSELLSRTLKPIWRRPARQRVHKRIIRAFVAEMSERLTYPVRLPQPEARKKSKRRRRRA